MRGVYDWSDLSQQMLAFPNAEQDMLLQPSVQPDSYITTSSSLGRLTDTVIGNNLKSMDDCIGIPNGFGEPDCSGYWIAKSFGLGCEYRNSTPVGSTFYNKLKQHMCVDTTTLDLEYKACPFKCEGCTSSQRAQT